MAEPRPPESLKRLIDRMVEIWLDTPFDGGRHARRVEKILALEKEVSAKHETPAG